MKRTFWLSLLLILFLGILLCDTAGADNHQGKWGNLSWTLDDNGTLTISGSGKMKDFSPDEDKAAWKQYGKDIREGCKPAEAPGDAGIRPRGGHDPHS